MLGVGDLMMFKNSDVWGHVTSEVKNTLTSLVFYVIFFLIHRSRSL